MTYTCPNHELSKEIILQNFYARLSHNDQTMLDTSCAGSFMKKTIEFRWDLLERIKRNSEDWELDEGKVLAWYRLCDDIGSWNWNRLKLEFHQKFILCI